MEQNKGSFTDFLKKFDKKTHHYSNQGRLFEPKDSYNTFWIHYFIDSADSQEKTVYDSMDLQKVALCAARSLPVCHRWESPVQVHISMSQGVPNRVAELKSFQIVIRNFQKKCQKLLGNVRTRVSTSPSVPLLIEAILLLQTIGFSWPCKTVKVQRNTHSVGKFLMSESRKEDFLRDCTYKWLATKTGSRGPAPGEGPREFRFYPYLRTTGLKSSTVGEIMRLQIRLWGVCVCSSSLVRFSLFWSPLKVQLQFNLSQRYDRGSLIC